MLKGTTVTDIIKWTGQDRCWLLRSWCFEAVVRIAEVTEPADWETLSKLSCLYLWETVDFAAAKLMTPPVRQAKYQRVLRNHQNYI